MWGAKVGGRVTRQPLRHVQVAGLGRGFETAVSFVDRGGVAGRVVDQSLEGRRLVAAAPAPTGPFNSGGEDALLADLQIHVNGAHIAANCEGGQREPACSGCLVGGLRPGPAWNWGALAFAASLRGRVRANTVPTSGALLATTRLPPCPSASWRLM